METVIPLTDTARISELRSRCRLRKHQSRTDTTLSDAASFQASSHIASHPIRIALRSKARLANLKLDLDELELLAGRHADYQPDTRSSAYQEARVYLDSLPYASTPGQTGHCELDRSLLFQLGLDGLLARLREKAARENDPDRRDTLVSFRYALEGLQILILNAAELCTRSIPEALPARQAELNEMAEICRLIAHEPPQTFREALQLVWMVDMGVSFADYAWLVNPGHLDRTLYPYYIADLDVGRINPEQALVLLECFYLLLNEYIPDGLAISVMVGGADAAGNDLTNPLSHLCLEALRRTNLVYPTVGICWTPATPASLTALAVDLISSGYTTPAFFNDQTIRRGLQAYGVPAGEAWNYINSTCVEITPVGSSNVWVASPYFAVCRYLLEEIADLADTNDQPADFEQFLGNYLARMDGAIGAAVEAENRSRLYRDAYGCKPLQSVFTRDCIERAQDIDRGGARYNWIECSFVGLANLVDSLVVIRNEVFEQNQLDFARLHTILENDFAGFDAEKFRFTNHYPKYGHNQGEAEALLDRIITSFQAFCAKYQVYPHGSLFVPGAFCWIMHEMLGKDTGATPDGRRAGTPFADGCGPAQGRERFGPTAAILSTTSWDHSPLIGGAAFNMKFNKPLLADATGKEGLTNLILTFLKRGGFEVQVNVVDSDAMRQARDFPEKYQDLIVRIGGYTDYFVRLSPRMQEELISRTEYAAF